MNIEVIRNIKKLKFVTLCILYNFFLLEGGMINNKPATSNGKMETLHSRELSEQSSRWWWKRLLTNLMIAMCDCCSKDGGWVINKIEIVMLQVPTVELSTVT